MADKKKRGCAFYFIYLFIMLLVCLLIAEIGLRLFWTPPMFHSVIRGNDPVYHHSNRSDEELATKDAWMRPIEKRKSPDEYRIFLVGDSFAHGMVKTREEAFCSKIQAEFNRRDTGKMAVVYNMAVLSYSPLINYLVIKNLVLPNDPDLVLMMVDSSDPQDDSLYELLAEFDEQGRPVAVRPPPDYDRLPLKLEMAWLVLKRIRKNGWHWETYEQERKHRISHYKDPYRFWDGAFNRTVQYIGLCGDLCEKKGIPFMIVHPPYPVVLKNKDPFDEWLTQWGFFKEATYTGKNINRAIWDGAIRTGAPYLNLEPAVLEMEEQLAAKGGTTDMIYKPEDGHFTELAHQAMAVTIVTFLLENLSPFKEK